MAVIPHRRSGERRNPGNAPKCTFLDTGLDTGALLASSRTSIMEEDDRGILTARLATLAAEMLISNLKLTCSR